MLRGKRWTGASNAAHYVRDIAVSEYGLKAPEMDEAGDYTEPLEVGEMRAQTKQQEWFQACEFLDTRRPREKGNFVNQRR